MKKLYLFFLLSLVAGQIIHAQNIGIGTLTPPYKLSVQTPKAAGNWGLMHSDSIVSVGDYISSTGVAEFGTRSGHPLWLIAGNHDSPFPAMTIDAAGINVGLGTLAPANHLQLGGTPGFSGNDIAIGNGTQAMSFFQSATTSTWYSNNNFSLMPAGGHGYVGIGIATPVNDLQIGNVGTTGYAGNALAIGNGISAMVFNQQVLEADWQTNSQIYLKPQNGGVLGRVYNTGSEYITGSINVGGEATITGNTSISGTVQISSSDENVPALAVSGAYYAQASPGDNALRNCNFCGPADLSIQAGGDIWANAFYALSDARYKNVAGISNTSGDLQTLNKIQITNYTLKDKTAGGGRQFKKVIAQQVEEVYPQIVSRGTNYLPDVYQATSSITKTAEGYLLRFENDHNLNKDAKKLKLVDKNNRQLQGEVLSIPSGKEVLIKCAGIKSDTLFVYGQQVNDFRAVDYEGLTTLNISATQELSKLVTEQKAVIKEQNEKIAGLSTKVEVLMQEIDKLTHK